MKQPKPDHDILHLCAHTCELLKRIGFERVNVSMKGESVYFRWPGRNGVLRVSAHRTKAGVIGLDNIVAKITFSPDGRGHGGTLRCDTQAVQSFIWRGIGQYMVNSATIRPPKYQPHASVDQWIDHQVPNLKAAGSSPAGRAMQPSLAETERETE